MLKKLVYLLPIVVCFSHISCGNESCHYKVTDELVNHNSSIHNAIRELITIDIIPIGDIPFKNPVKKIKPKLVIESNTRNA